MSKFMKNKKNMSTWGTKKSKKVKGSKLKYNKHKIKSVIVINKG